MILTNIYVFVLGLCIYSLIPMIIDKTEKERVVITFCTLFFILFVRSFYLEI